MNKSKKASPSKEDKVAESAATAYSESDNTQPDEDKSQREAEKQGDKVAESTSAAYNQSVNTQSDKNQSLPPKVNTKRKKVVKSATTNQNQSQSDQQQPSADTSQAEDEQQSEKDAQSTTTAPNENQSDQQQSSTDTSSTPAYMQYYATKEDLSNAKGEIIEKIGDTRKENADEHGITREKMAEIKVYVGDKIQTASNFLIAIFISILVLVITLVGVAIAVIQSSNGS